LTGFHDVEFTFYQIHLSDHAALDVPRAAISGIKPDDKHSAGL
jgi:hypothetical protein